MNGSPVQHQFKRENSSARFLKSLASGSPIVTMQPTQSLIREDVSRGYGGASTWCSLPESKMRAVFVVIANVFRQQMSEMCLIQRNCVIHRSPQQLLTQHSATPFC